MQCGPIYCCWRLSSVVSCQRTEEAFSSSTRTDFDHHINSDGVHARALHGVKQGRKAVYLAGMESRGFAKEAPWALLMLAAERLPPWSGTATLCSAGIGVLCWDAAAAAA